MDNLMIGIDLGHCETAAAFPRRLDHNNRYEVRRLVSENKDQVISTQIILTGDQMQKLAGIRRPSYEDLCLLGEIKIGNKLSAYIPNGEKFCYFKVPPKEFDSPCGNSEAAKQSELTHGQVMACFLFALVNNLFKYNREDLSMFDREQTVLLIGCPSTQDWISEEAMQDYADLAKRAVNVREVKMIPESRAAMFSSVENEKNQISAVRGAVVFDFGSSTADCTYMLLGRKMMEFSWTLGASEIERQMALAAYQSVVESHGPFQVKMTSFADREDDLRAVKEKYYDHGFGPDGYDWVASFVDRDDKKVRQLITIDEKFMNQIVEENPIQVLCDSKTFKNGTWASLCRAFFEEAKQQISSATYMISDGKGEKAPQKCELESVVLTGGASRMDFIAQLCREVFPDENIKIRREDNPSHTVSNGLGWVAVSEDRLPSCMENAKKEVTDDPACQIEALCTRLLDVVYEKISEIVESETRKWAETPGDDLTARDLQNSMESYLNSEAEQKELLLICEKEIDDWKNKLSQAVEAAVNHQVEQLYAESVAKGLTIPNDIWKQLQSGVLSLHEIDTSKILEGIDMAGIGAQVGKILAQIAMWAIAVVLAGPTGGWSLVVAWIGDMLVGDIKDVNPDEKRSQKIRRKVADRITGELPKLKCKTKVMKAFRENLESQTENFETILDDTLKTAFEVVMLKRFEIREEAKADDGQCHERSAQAVQGGSAE